MFLGTGTRKGVAEVGYALDLNDGVPHMEGLTIFKGRVPREERIKMDYERFCVDCGEEDAYSGVYRVAATDYYCLGLRVYQSVNSVTYTCLRCLHEQDPVEYPYPDMGAYMEGEFGT